VYKEDETQNDDPGRRTCYIPFSLSRHSLGRQTAKLTNHD